MRLKYLSLCLLSLSFFGCAQHMVNPQANGSKENYRQGNLDQRASKGLNAMFETSSFDIKGQLSVTTTQPKIKISSAPNVEKQNIQLDEDIRKKVDQVLKAQKINLSEADKKALYESLVFHSDPYDYLLSYGYGESRSEKFISGLLNYLNAIEVSYDGSVHYREKLASLNLNLQYNQPTLYVKAKVPMALDLNNDKFYINYSGILPFFVNPKYKNTMAYFDFSKYKEDINKVNIKGFVEYFKQLNTLPYVLADPSQLKGVAISADEKKRGIVEKIKLQTNLGEFIYQLASFNYINEHYVVETLLGKEWSEENEEYSEVVEVAASEAVSGYEYYEEDYEEDDNDKSIREASESVERVFTLVNQIMYELDSDPDEEEYEYIDASSEGYAEDYEEDAVASEVYVEDYEEDVIASEAYVEDYEDQSEIVSEKVCKGLLNSKDKVPVGYVRLCNIYYDIQLLSLSSKNELEQNEDDSELYVESDVSHDVREKLKKYRTAKLTDVYAFKKLWDEHQVEIQKELNEQDIFDIPVAIYVSLDAKGRAQEVIYDVLKTDTVYGDIHFLSTTEYSNYGKATPIDKKALQSAKSIEEISKDTAFENFPFNLFNVSEESEESEDFDGVSEKSIKQMKKLTLDTYKRTGSYIKTYQVIFAMYYAAERPEEFKYYSTSDINEIAELSAYHFNSDLDKPTGQEAKRLEKLAEKHNLKKSNSFDLVGNSAYNLIDSVLFDMLEEQYWQNLKKKHKSQQSMFESHYEKVFKDSYDVSNDNLNLLKQASKVMAQSFVDDVNGKLSEKSLQNFEMNHEYYIDSEIYYQTYKDIMKHYKK